MRAGARSAPRGRLRSDIIVIAPATSHRIVDLAADQPDVMKLVVGHRLKMPSCLPFAIVHECLDDQFRHKAASAQSDGQDSGGWPLPAHTGASFERPVINL